MEKKTLPISEALYPVPVVLVSSIDLKKNRPNIITVAWCGVACSDPAQLSISVRPSRYSHGLIKETGDFVVNIPSTDMINKVDSCGIVSGRAIDKFSRFSLTPQVSALVRSPMIAECPVSIECSLQKTIELGAHDMFIGAIRAVHADPYVLGRSDAVDHTRTSPIVYCNGEYWSLGRKIGKYGFSPQENSR